MGIPPLVMLAIQLIITVASVIYQRQRAQKMKAQAEAEADKQRGFQLVTEGQAEPVNVYYGRNKVGGTRVYHRVAGTMVSPCPLPTAPGHMITSRDNGKRVTSVVVTGYAAASLDGTVKVPATAGTFININTTASVGATTLSLNIGAQTAENLPAFQPGCSITLKHPSIIYTGDTAPTDVKEFTYTIASFTSGALVVTLTGVSTNETTTPALATWSASDGSLKDNELLFIQQVIGYAGINKVYSIEVDGKDLKDPFFNSTLHSTGSIRCHIYEDGNVADPMMAANDASRATAKFTNCAYLSMVFRLNRKEPQYQGIPTVQCYIEGQKVYKLEKVGGVVQLSSSKEYSNNPALCLLDYMMSSVYGKGLPASRIDLDSFYEAMLICDIRAPLQDGTSIAPPLGELWEEKVAQVPGAVRDIHLYECNMGIDTTRPVRDNIEVILETMGQAELLWSGGKYKLQLVYPMEYGAMHTVYSGSNKDMKFGAGTYNIGDMVQYPGGSSPGPDINIYRSLIDNNSATPGTNPSAWAADVVKAFLTDDDIIRDESITQAWPNSQQRLNYFTVKFLNEAKNFTQDSVSWPPKFENGGPYDIYLAEDKDILLEGEMFQAGDCTEFHAKATAEERVRFSRSNIVYSFGVPIKYAFLEPGDIFRVNSEVLGIPGELMRVEEIKINDKLQAIIQAYRYDCRQLAWNAKDDEVVDNLQVYQSEEIKQATNLTWAPNPADISVALSSGRLSWTAADDKRVKEYHVKITKAPYASIGLNTLWNNLGVTQGTSFEVPLMVPGTYVLTVVASDGAGKFAPEMSFWTGSRWPRKEVVLGGALSQTTLVTIYKQAATIPATPSGGQFDFETFKLVTTPVDTVPAGWSQTIPATSSTPTWVSQAVAKAIFPSTKSAAHPPGITTWSVPVQFTQSGAAGMTFKLTADNYVFIYTSATGVTTPDNITLTASLANAPAGATATYAWETNYEGSGGWVPHANTAATLVVNKSEFASAKWKGYKATVTVTPAGGSATVLSDTLTLAKISDGSGLTVLMPNETHNLNANEAGVVSSYAGSGTPIMVWYNTEPIPYSATPAVVGTFTIATPVVNPVGGITVGSISAQAPNSAIVADHSNMTQSLKQVTISYPLTFYAHDGSVWAANKIQSINKSKDGQNAITGELSNSAHILQVAADTGTIDYTGSGTRIYVKSGGANLPYDPAGSPAINTFKVASSFISGSCTVGSFSNGSPTFTGMLVGNHSGAEASSFPIVIRYTITVKKHDGTDYVFTLDQTLAKGGVGQTGQKSVSLSLYQWNSNVPAPPSSGLTTYTWATSAHALGSPAPNNGWLINPGNNNNPSLLLYEVKKTIVVPNSETVSTANWSSGVGPVQNSSGPPGMNFAMVRAYKWALTVPTTPVGGVWTWASLSLTTLPSGWFNDSASAGSGVQGQTLWEASININDAPGTATHNMGSWTGASLKAVGYSGANGPVGNSYVKAYCKTTAANLTVSTSTTTSTGQTSVPPNGWATVALVNGWNVNSSAMLPLANGESMYQSDGIYNPQTNTITWETPYLSNLKVGNLSAISANLGTVSITGGGCLNGGWIDTNGNWIGTDDQPGFFINSLMAKFGSPKNYLTWNNTNLTYTGSLQAVSGTFDSLTVTSNGYAKSGDVFLATDQTYTRSPNGGWALSNLSNNPVFFIGKKQWAGVPHSGLPGDKFLTYYNGILQLYGTDIINTDNITNGAVSNVISGLNSVFLSEAGGKTVIMVSMTGVAHAANAGEAAVALQLNLYRGGVFIVSHGFVAQTPHGVDDFTASWMTDYPAGNGNTTYSATITAPYGGYAEAYNGSNQPANAFMVVMNLKR